MSQSLPGLLIGKVLFKAHMTPRSISVPIFGTFSVSKGTKNNKNIISVINT